MLGCKPIMIFLYRKFDSWINNVKNDTFALLFLREREKMFTVEIMA